METGATRLAWHDVIQYLSINGRGYDPATSRTVLQLSYKINIVTHKDSSCFFLRRVVRLQHEK